MIADGITRRRLTGGSAIWTFVVLAAALACVLGWNAGRWIADSSRSLLIGQRAGSPIAQAPLRDQPLAGCLGLDVSQIESLFGPRIASASDFEMVPYESGVTSQITQLNLFGVHHSWLLPEEARDIDSAAWWIFSRSGQFDIHVGEVTGRLARDSRESVLKTYYPKFEGIAVRFDENGIAERCVRLGPITHVRIYR